MPTPGCTGGDPLAGSAGGPRRSDSSRISFGSLSPALPTLVLIRRVGSNPSSPQLARTPRNRAERPGYESKHDLYAAAYQQIDPEQHAQDAQRVWLGRTSTTTPMMIAMIPTPGSHTQPRRARRSSGDSAPTRSAPCSVM